MPANTSPIFTLTPNVTGVDLVRISPTANVTFTSGSALFSGADLGLSQADIGSPIRVTTSTATIPAGTTIFSVQSPTAGTMSANAGGTTSTVSTATIGVLPLNPVAPANAVYPFNGAAGGMLVIYAGGVNGSRLGGISVTNTDTIAHNIYLFLVTSYGGNVQAVGNVPTNLLPGTSSTGATAYLLGSTTVPASTGIAGAIAVNLLTKLQLPWLDADSAMRLPNAALNPGGSVLAVGYGTTAVTGGAVLHVVSVGMDF